ncbi:MAG: alpha/beta fold hydrolase [bacterium]
MEKENFYEDDGLSQKEEFKQNESISKIFEKERAQYISEVGKQLENPQTATIEIKGKPVNLDYRIISIESLEDKDYDPVIVLPGFGSGWEGISELCFSLACEGRKAITFSLPGYGKSDNPPAEYLGGDDFSAEAEAVAKFVEKLRDEGKIGDNKIHLVGHSMAGAIISEYAAKNSEQVSSLTLLDSAGVNKKENITALATKFFASGIHTVAEYKARLALSGEEEYEKEIHKHIPKTQSPFKPDRVKQRLAEARKLSSGKVVENLENLDAPVIYMSGELDLVFPPGEASDENSQLAKMVNAVNDKAKIETSVLYGLRHNTTISADEITAANINHCLEEAEKKNRSEDANKL